MGVGAAHLTKNNKCTVTDFLFLMGCAVREENKTRLFSTSPQVFFLFFFSQRASHRLGLSGLRPDFFPLICSIMGRAVFRLEARLDYWVWLHFPSGG